MARIKVETESPLPPLRAWHLVQSPTIAHLKSTLCSTVLPNYSPHSISLSLDGFLLLDPTPADVLRDGDLLRSAAPRISFFLCLTPCIARIQQSPPSVLAPSQKHVVPPLTKRPRPSDSESSDEDSSSDETSSESSSSSDESSSSATSSSSDSSAPLELPSKHQPSTQCVHLLSCL